jgi:Protein of unknown function with HXXEE motif
MTRFETTFLALILAQAAHATEEYLGRLYEVFAPARFVSGLFSQDLERGFLIFNVSLVVFGFWCFLWPVRKTWPSAIPIAWLWVAIELLNGIGHPLWSLLQLRYTPGLVTAVVLLIIALHLMRQLLARDRSSGDLS